MGRRAMPPECLVATRSAGAAPRPASRRLEKRPQWTRWAHDKRNSGGGDYEGITRGKPLRNIFAVSLWEKPTIAVQARRSAFDPKRA